MISQYKNRARGTRRVVRILSPTLVMASEVIVRIARLQRIVLAECSIRELIEGESLTKKMPGITSVNRGTEIALMA